MSRAADAYKNVVARPYPPGGCQVPQGKEKCGETIGLDIITDFHKLYEEKMSQIDVSAGGDSLQEKVDLQQDWINDLTEQNKMLAKVIQELEKEAINRVQQLEDKLKNAVKSLGEDENKQSPTLTETDDKRKLEEHHQEELKEETPPVPEKQSEEDYNFKEGTEEENYIMDEIISQAKSEKSVHLVIQDEESPNKMKIVEPEKTPPDDLPETIEKPPPLHTGDLKEAHDSVELQISKVTVQPVSETSICHCEENLLNEIEKLKQEKKMLEDGEEIQRLKEEIQEKMKRILELNEENRALNDTINTLKDKTTKENTDPTSDSELLTSDSEHGTRKGPRRNPATKRKLTCREKCGQNKYEKIPEIIKKICVCRELTDTKKTSPECIAVYNREDKEKFSFDSSSTVCNEDLCPFFENMMRARGGHDSENFRGGEQPSSSGMSVPTPNAPLEELTCPAFQGQVDVATTCQQWACPKDCNVAETITETCLNVTCFEGVTQDEVPGPNNKWDVCYDDTCPEKEQYSSQTPAPSIQEKSIVDPLLCSDSSCDLKESSSHVVDQVIAQPRPNTSAGICPSTHVTCACVPKPNESGVPPPVPQEIGVGVAEAKPRPMTAPELGTRIHQELPGPTCARCGCTLEENDLKSGMTFDASVNAVSPVSDKETTNQVDIQKSAPIETKDADEEVYKIPPLHAEEGEPQDATEEKGSEMVAEKLSVRINDKPTEYMEEEPLQNLSEKPSEKVGEEPSEQQEEEKPSELVSEKPSEHLDEEASENLNEKPSEPLSEKPSENLDEKPSENLDEKPSENLDEKPSELVDERSSELVSEKPSEHVNEEPSKDVAEKPSEQDEKPSDVIPTPQMVENQGNIVIRCVCKSKYCKVVVDPNNPNQRLCIDSSQTNLELQQTDENCVCNPSCPKKGQDEDFSRQQNSKPSDAVCEEECSPNYTKETSVYTVTTGFQQVIPNLKEFIDTKNEELSKKEEYAGLSRKDMVDYYSEKRYISPRKATSSYGFPEDIMSIAESENNMKDEDLKLVIANLKGKLLDAEDKIEELKSIKNFGTKDNNMAVILKYSDEIEQLKKSLKWSKKEKEEYEYLKQKIKMMEKGKGDTESITSNLQTAEDKTMMKSQLKKLSKKNKCYEEVVRFFKDEMSVMSDELLTLQEVLNATNVCSQEENSKLIKAILQLRRINDRLVDHLCAIEKQMVLENQLNQINETRINELQQIIGAKNNDLNQHEEIIHDMRRKLSNANKQNVDLKKKIQNLTDTVVEIQEGIIQVEKGQQKNKEEVEVVKSEVCIANGDIEQIKTCMGQKNGKIEELENQLKSKEVTLILANKELEMLKEAKTNKKELVASLKEQLSVSEKKKEQIMKEYDTVLKQLQDYTSLDRMRNYELNHYKNIVDEMRMSLMQLNNGLERCEATNVHFYEEFTQPNRSISLKEALNAKRSDITIVFDELKRSMADMKRRLSDADFKGALIEEELLKVRESHRSQIQEEAISLECERELKSKILSTIEEQDKLHQLVEEQKEEIEMLKMALEKEKEMNNCCCKRSVSELKNEKMNSNAQMELSQLKTELRKSLQRQKHLNDENDKMHTQMINLRKKLTIMENAYEVLKQENEEYKMQLKKTMREKEYLGHKNHELTKIVDQLKNERDELNKQCRALMRRVSDEKNWIKTPTQRPFSPKRFGTARTERRAQSPSKNASRKRSPSPDIPRYRSSSPWRSLSPYREDEIQESHSHNHRNNNKLLRNISYDSNCSPFSSRSPSPHSDSFRVEQEIDNINLHDWFSPHYKETETDADEGDEDSFLGKVQMMTYHVQEANRRWQHMKNKERISRPRTKEN